MISSGPAFAATLLCAGGAAAGEMREGGKLLLTHGVSAVEGAAGGGLASWAVIAGDETRDGVGGEAHVTYVGLPDYRLTTFGAAVGLLDRLELSYARQAFDTGATGAKLGLGRGFTFHQDVVGVKVRLVGDAVYDQDSWLPQLAAGLQVKHNDRGAIVRAVGGKSADGTDVYLAATKVLLGQSLVLDATARLTKANQTGLLGFGGDRRNAYRPQFEGSAGYLISRRLVVGGEYRTKPDNLGFAREDDWFDVFGAYAVNRNLSVTAAYVDAGSIATFKGQRGVYLSLQAGF
jgi:hypothetical protein